MKYTRHILNNDGSILISMLIAFILISILIGIVIRTTVFLSSLSLATQQYTMHTYAADALMHYGIAHVIEQYDILLEQDIVHNTLVLPQWPTGIETESHRNQQELYAGTITIQKEKPAFGIKAVLLQRNIPVHTITCTLLKNNDNSFSIKNWIFY